MELTVYKAIAAVLIFFVSIITGLFPLKKLHGISEAESLQLGEALASGIFLGAAFFHMLPDAISVFANSKIDQYPIPELICVAGFLLLLFLERLSFVRAKFIKNPVPYIVTLTLILHALIEGLALGIGPNFSEALMIFIAILAHKGSESYALCVVLISDGIYRTRIILFIVLFSLMTPIGIAFGAMVNELAVAKNGDLIGAAFNAFAAGSFLYISTLHHVHFHRHARDVQSLLEFSFLVIGVTMMALLAVLH